MKTITKKECREALEYFWNCEDVDNMTTDRSFYLKILLNKVSQLYKMNHLLKWEDK